MPFPQLHHYKLDIPEWSDKLTLLERFLDEVLHRAPTNPREFFSTVNHDIDPLWVSSILKISKSEAIALLYLCDKAGIVKPRFDVYCPTTEKYIDSYYSSSDLPSLIDCHWHEYETEHSVQDYYVNLFFEFTSQIVEGEFTLAAAG
jgi:hypothetical protein